MSYYSTRNIMKGMNNTYENMVGKRYQLQGVSDSTWIKEGLEVVVTEILDGIPGLFSPELQLSISTINICEYWRWLGRISVGSKVEVVNNIDRQWAMDNVPGYLDKCGIKNNINVGDIGKVVAITNHEREGEVSLYVVEKDSKLSLVSEHSVVFAKPDLIKK